MISDCYAFPVLFPSLLPPRLSDTGSVAEGGAMVWDVNQRYALPCQHSGTLALGTGLSFGGYIDTAFEWLLLLLFTGLAEILGWSIYTFSRL